MSADALHHDDYDSVEVDSPHGFSQMLARVEPYLSEEGRQAMHAEVGEALLHTIATGNDAYVNNAVEAWHRTLMLKALGTDQHLDAQEEPVDEEPISLEQIRARRRK